MDQLPPDASPVSLHRDIDEINDQVHVIYVGVTKPQPMLGGGVGHHYHLSFPVTTVSESPLASADGKTVMIPRQERVGIDIVINTSGKPTHLTGVTVPALLAVCAHAVEHQVRESAEDYDLEAAGDSIMSALHHLEASAKNRS